MQLDKFTEKFRLALQTGSEIAQDKGNPEMESLHVMAGFLQDQDNTVWPS